MQNSIRYLQCTTKKLHSELNVLRSSEKVENISYTLVHTSSVYKNKF